MRASLVAVCLGLVAPAALAEEPDKPAAAAPSGDPAATPATPPAEPVKPAPSAVEGPVSEPVPATPPVTEPVPANPAPPVSEPVPATPTPPVSDPAPATEPVAPAPLPAAKKDPYPPMVLSGPDKAANVIDIGGKEAGFRIRVPVRLSGRGETVSSYAIDRYGNTDGGSLSTWPRARLGLIAEFPPKEKPDGSFGVRFEYEHDLTGALTSPSSTVPILNAPGSEPMELQLRKAFLTLDGLGPVRVNVGAMTSQWGLGLVANDGDHGWAPGNARFTDPRAGDRVARVQLATAPLSDMSWVASVAADWVLDDDILLKGPELKPGQGDDTAKQVIGALVYGAGKATTAGAYVVQRWQDAADGRWLRATVFDLAASHEGTLEGGTYKLEAEAVLTTGQTTYAGTIDFAVQDVLQFGAAARGTLDFGGWGTVLDVMYATGDQNADDKTQNTFRADPNYEMGLVLFRHVLASQTGRTTYTAGDPTLVGHPAPGLERVPSRGSVGNAILFFPRLNFRPMAGLELFGGVLVAVSEVPQIDAFNTRLAGGQARNALDGIPNNHLGTEFDLGARSRFLVNGIELGVGAEGGLLLPGGALAGPLSLPAPMWAARLMLDVRL